MRRGIAAFLPQHTNFGKVNITRVRPGKVHLAFNRIGCRESGHRAGSTGIRRRKRQVAGVARVAHTIGGPHLVMVHRPRIKTRDVQ